MKKCKKLLGVFLAALMMFSAVVPVASIFAAADVVSVSENGGNYAVVIDSGDPAEFDLEGLTTSTVIKHSSDTSNFPIEVGEITGEYGYIAGGVYKLLSYTPTKIVNGIDKFEYSKGNNAVDGEIDIIPASVMYYDDNFLFTDGEGNEGAKDGITFTGSWRTVDTDIGEAHAVGVSQKDIDALKARYNLNNFVEYIQYLQALNALMKDNVGTDGKATFTFEFTGTGFELLSYIGTDAGIITASVDGESVSVSNYYPLGSIYRVPTISMQDLGEGSHTVTISVDWKTTIQSAGNFVVIDAIRIFNTLDDKSNYEEEDKNAELYRVIDLVKDQDNALDFQFLGTADDYAKSFALNEVYLYSGVGVQFTLDLTNLAATEKPIAKLEVKEISSGAAVTVEVKDGDTVIGSKVYDSLSKDAKFIDLLNGMDVEADKVYEISVIATSSVGSALSEVALNYLKLSKVTTEAPAKAVGLVLDRTSLQMDPSITYTTNDSTALKTETVKVIGIAYDDGSVEEVDVKDAKFIGANADKFSVTSFSGNEVKIVSTADSANLVGTLEITAGGETKTIVVTSVNPTTNSGSGADIPYTTYLVTPSNAWSNIYVTNDSGTRVSVAHSGWHVALPTSTALYPNYIYSYQDNYYVFRPTTSVTWNQSLHAPTGQTNTTWYYVGPSKEPAGTTSTPNAVKQPTRTGIDISSSPYTVEAGQALENVAALKFTTSDPTGTEAFPKVPDASGTQTRVTLAAIDSKGIEASIDDNGVMTFDATNATAGQATFEVTYGSLPAKTITVTVTPKPVMNGIVANRESVTVAPESTTTIKIQQTWINPDDVKDFGAGSHFVLDFDDAKINAVEKGNGVIEIIGIAEGETVLTVTYPGFSSIQIAVSVIDAVKELIPLEDITFSSYVSTSRNYIYDNWKTKSFYLEYKIGDTTYKVTKGEIDLNNLPSNTKLSPIVVDEDGKITVTRASSGLTSGDSIMITFKTAHGDFSQKINFYEPPTPSSLILTTEETSISTSWDTDKIVTEIELEKGNDIPIYAKNLFEDGHLQNTSLITITNKNSTIASAVKLTSPTNGVKITANGAGEAEIVVTNTNNGNITTIKVTVTGSSSFAPPATWAAWTAVGNVNYNGINYTYDSTVALVNWNGTAHSYAQYSVFMTDSFSGNFYLFLVVGASGYQHTTGDSRFANSITPAKTNGTIVQIASGTSASLTPTKVFEYLGWVASAPASAPVSEQLALTSMDTQPALSVILAGSGRDIVGAVPEKYGMYSSLNYSSTFNAVRSMGVYPTMAVSSSLPLVKDGDSFTTEDYYKMMIPEGDQSDVVVISIADKFTAKESTPDLVAAMESLLKTVHARTANAKIVLIGTKGDFDKYMTKAVDQAGLSAIVTYCEDITSTASGKGAIAEQEAMQAVVCDAIAKAASIELKNDEVVAEWTQGASYKIGDVVVYNGVKYECVVAHEAKAVAWNPISFPQFWKSIA